MWSVRRWLWGQLVDVGSEIWATWKMLCLFSIQPPKTNGWNLKFDGLTKGISFSRATIFRFHSFVKAETFASFPEPLPLARNRILHVPDTHFSLSSDMSPWSDRMHRRHWSIRVKVFWTKKHLRPPKASKSHVLSHGLLPKIIHYTRNSEGIWKPKIGPIDCGYGWVDPGSHPLPPGRLRAPRIGRRDNEPRRVSWWWFICWAQFSAVTFFHCIFPSDITWQLSIQQVVSMSHER